MANTTSMPGGLMTGSFSVGKGGKTLSPRQKANKAAEAQPIPIKTTKPIPQMPGTSVPVRTAKPKAWGK